MSGTGDQVTPGRIEKLAGTAKLLGKSAVVPAVRSILREQVTSIMAENDPEDLEELIDVQYALVENELPEGYKNALRNVGPQFTDVVQSTITPDQVQNWLDNPADWMNVEENPHKAADIRECGRIIREHPKGRAWLEAQVLYVYEITGVLDQA